MAEYLVKWPSKRGPISEIRPSDGRGENSVPSTVVRGYDPRKPGGHLGNVGSNPLNSTSNVEEPCLHRPDISRVTDRVFLMGVPWWRNFGMITVGLKAM